MTTVQIAIAIFSSSLLSAALTSLVNYRLTSVNYKNEYYKKLLDKRLIAYEELHIFLGQFRVHIHDANDNTLVPYIFVNGLKNLEEVSVGLLLPIKHSIWLSSALSYKLNQLSALLNKIEQQARNSPNPNESLIKIANEGFLQLKEKRNEIESIMKEDLKTLHNIDSFFINNNQTALKK
ncbi:MAG: hypothetical protein JWQ25_1268 [Daejeonella sp.]|nr:hypothetical protein [Daejeonella sp.]